MDTHKIDKDLIVLYGATDTNGNIIVTPNKEKFILVNEDKACWGNQNDEYIVTYAFGHLFTLCDIEEYIIYADW